MNLYKLLFPQITAPATTNNILASNIANYNSFNGIIKLDHHFSDKQQVSIHYLGTTGKQTAPTGSFYAQYFQTAPMHIHNFDVQHSYVFTPHVLNTVTLATNYFLQTFNDANQNYNPSSVGLNLGLAPGIVAAGAPTIIIGGTSCPSAFDCTGATQPSGRTDVTGHITDNFHWTLGRHEMKFGGEFRHSNVNQLYFSSARGTFAFDGTRGPWVDSAGATLANSPLGSLADYLIGAPTNSSGAKLLQGSAQRVWTLNTIDAWAQDDFKVNSHLNLNLGVRYTIPGVIHAAADDIYQFVPGTTPGFQKGYYPEYYGGAAPRIGFSYSPHSNNSLVIRGSYGIFYDFPAMSSWITGTTGNGGANYAQNNPAGPDAAAIFVQSNVRWTAGVNPFTGASAPRVGAFGVNQNFKMPRATVVSFNVEQQLSKSTLFSVGYVGTFGQHLEVLYNIDQPVASGTPVSNLQPYQQTSFPNQNSLYTGKTLAAINQLNFSAASNYHSLQTTLRQTAWKGLTTTVNYTWSKSLDDASSNTTPMNSYNLHMDYGPSTFDNRHLLNGFVYYNIPQLGHFLPKLTKGYQINALGTYSSGTPINIAYTSNVDGTGELKDRPNYTGVSPYVGGVQLETSGSASRTYRYLTKNLVGNPSFVCPGLTIGQITALPATKSTTNAAACPNVAGFAASGVTGQYGNLQRDNFSGPNFKTIDLSLFKHTPITEKVMSEFRVELFNVFNFNNFANPTTTATSSTFGVITTTRNAAGAPGIGYGEPFNIQFALKLSF